MLLSGHCCKKKRKAATDIVAAERKEPFVLTTCGSFVQFCLLSRLFNSIRLIFATFPGKGEMGKKEKNKKMQDFAIGKYTLFISIPFSLPLFSQIERKKLLERIGHRALAIGLFPSGAANATFRINERKKKNTGL